MVTFPPIARPGGRGGRQANPAAARAGLRPDAADRMNIDVSNRLSDSMVPFMAVVVGLSLILLTMMFRSLVIPLKGAVGFLLSVAASLGTVVALFQWGLAHTGPVVSFLPIILIGVLFGLAMDYEVFLLSGMREEWVHTGKGTPVRDRRRAAQRAGRHRGGPDHVHRLRRVLPPRRALIKPIAFALAVGVAIDAFAVRMTLVPAVLALAGRHAWWLPAWLGRVLPDLDVEGTSLEKAPTVEPKQPKEHERVS
jgi:RND superfamily putative drug exporter